MHWTDQDKLCVIVNAKAGLGSGVSRLFRKLLGLRDRQDLSHQQLLECLHRELCSHNFVCDIHESQYAGHAEVLARQAVDDGYACVVAVGGDGTINEVAGALMGTGVPLGVIPFGTANLLAMELDLPTTIAQACQTIVRGNAKFCDMGQMGDRSFVVMAGVGYDAHVVRSVTARLKQKWGALSYVIQMLGCLPSYKLKPIDVTLGDGQTFSAYYAFIQNGRFYGGKYIMAHDALMDDGLLDIISFLRPNAADVVAYVMGQAGKSPHIRRDKITSCTIAGHHPFECDGDYAGQTPAQITVIPEAIKIIR